MLVHGHCHQKAFGLMDGVLAALRLIPGAQVSMVERSCCGMAGSFGYEAAHQEASMRMAELSLLPAVRAAKDAIIVADGTSCRHQIADGASIAAPSTWRRCWRTFDRRRRSLNRGQPWARARARAP